jgi:hypothetical protein
MADLFSRLAVEEDSRASGGQEHRDPLTPAAREAGVAEDFQEERPGD